MPLTLLRMFFDRRSIRIPTANITKKMYLPISNIDFRNQKDKQPLPPSNNCPLGSQGFEVGTQSRPIKRLHTSNRINHKLNEFLVKQPNIRGPEF